MLIPKIVKKALDRLQHPKPIKPQYAPYFWKVPEYGKRPQIAPYPMIATLLTKIPQKNTVYCGNHIILCLIS